MYLVRIIFHPKGGGFKEFYFSREYLSVNLSPRSLPAKEGGELGKETNRLTPLPLISGDSLGMKLPFNLSCPCTLLVATAGFSLSSISPHMIKQVANIFFQVEGRAAFGEGAGQVWLETLRCTGEEGNITLCAHSGWGVSSCGHWRDAGVTCTGS